MNNMDQNADILPKLWCQNIGANKGTIAIDNKIPINGIIENNDKFSPKLPVEAEIELNSIQISNIFFIFIFKKYKYDANPLLILI